MRAAVSAGLSASTWAVAIVAAGALLHGGGDGVAFRDGAGGEGDFPEDFGDHGAFVGDDIADSAGSDDEDFVHDDGWRKGWGIRPGWQGGRSPAMRRGGAGAPGGFFPTTFGSHGVFFPASLSPDSNTLFPHENPPIHPQIRRRRGFTLLEMVIVLGIIAMIMGGAIFAMRGIGEAGQADAGEVRHQSVPLRPEFLQDQQGPLSRAPRRAFKALVDRARRCPRSIRIRGAAITSTVSRARSTTPSRKSSASATTARKAPKMTSTARNCSPRAGFTLLEIVIVLAIASLVMGGAVGLMMFSSDEQALRKASGEIELLAKRARTTAILQQTPYALEFREGIVRMMPLAQAGREEKKTAGGHRIGGEPEDETVAATAGN